MPCLVSGRRWGGVCFFLGWFWGVGKWLVMGRFSAKKWWNFALTLIRLCKHFFKDASKPSTFKLKSILIIHKNLHCHSTNFWHWKPIDCWFAPKTPHEAYLGSTWPMCSPIPNSVQFNLVQDCSIITIRSLRSADLIAANKICALLHHRRSDFQGFPSNPWLFKII